MALRLSLKGICILVVIVLAFLFPAELIDAIKLEDEEKARDVRGKACVCFGFMIILLLLLILGSL